MSGIDSVLSHGTIEVRDLAATRRFFENFLGLKVIQPLPVAIYADGGGGWQLVCVRSGLKMKKQSRHNRFCLHVESEAMVKQAQVAAEQLRDQYDIREVGPIEQVDGAIRFILQDLNNVWWEISARTKRPLN
ncbi:MAG TPA: VOC family protein [Sphingobium sp.]